MVRKGAVGHVTDHLNHWLHQNTLKSIVLEMAEAHAEVGNRLVGEKFRVN